MLIPQPGKSPSGVLLIILMRLVASGLIATSQFVDEMLQMRRSLGRVRAKNLLEALSHGVADRSAGLVIERFNVICG